MTYRRPLFGLSYSSRDVSPLPLPLPMPRSLCRVPSLAFARPHLLAHRSLARLLIELARTIAVRSLSQFVTSLAPRSQASLLEIASSSQSQPDPVRAPRSARGALF